MGMLRYKFLLMTLLAMLCLTVPGVFAQATASATQCGFVDESITLTRILNESGTCLTVNTSNIFINGSGFGLLSDDGQGVGILAINKTNVTILGFHNISNYTRAIEFYNVSASTIDNNTVLNSGIYLSNQTNNITIVNTYANLSAAGKAALTLNQSSDNNITSSNFSTIGSGAAAVIVTNSSSNNLFTSSLFNSTQSHSLRLINGSDNTFRDIELIAGGNNVQIGDATGSVLGNLTYNQTLAFISFDAGAIGTAYISWFLSIHVNHTNESNITGANVSIFNVTGHQVGELTTNATGQAGPLLVNNTFMNFTNNISLGNHIVNLSLSALNITQQSVNLTTTNSTQLNFTMVGDDEKPTISKFTLNTLTPIQGDPVFGSCVADDAQDPAAVTIRLEGISSEELGEQTATCKATDTAGNELSLDLAYEVILLGGGSGGGGSSGGASDLGSTSTSSSKAYADVSSGKTVSMSFEDVPVSTISFTNGPETDASRAWIRVEQKNSIPVEAAPNLVHKYLSISKSSLLADDQMEGITIEFFVTKEWLAENGVDKQHVMLYRYEGDKWVELPHVELLRTEADTVHYSAVTPGFSFFAIAGKAGEEERVTVEEYKEKEAAEARGTPEPEVEPAEPEQEVEEATSWAWLIVLTVAILLAIVLGYKYYKDHR